jgi:hypothetical protein
VAGVLWSWRGPGTVVTLALVATVAAVIVSALALKGVRDKPMEAGAA